jgi:dTDP-4-amino-4,6-dideoxygalactose transaminase
MRSVSSKPEMRIPATIPFVDVVTPHVALEEELLTVFRAALRSGTFVGGAMVEDFEREFARHCGARFCIGVSGGREALKLALLATGVSREDIVLTVPNALASTAEAISQVGARPDFIDVDDRTGTMDPNELERHLCAQCRTDPATGAFLDRTSGAPLAAIVPVHLHGQMADMDPILEIAERYGLVVIEDASQAHGAEYFSNKESRWRKAGSMGHVAAFGFDPGANLGACGEAGTVTTNDGEIAKEVRRLRDRDQTQQTNEYSAGQDSGLNTLQAGFLEVKLRHLADWDKKRRENAFCYHGLLTSVADRIRIPYEPSWAKATYHSYAIRLRKRDDLRTYLQEAKIATRTPGVLSWHVKHPNRAVRDMSGGFPVAERIASESLSLPIYPHLEFDQQCRIAQKIIDFVAREKAESPIRPIRGIPKVSDRAEEETSGKEISENPWNPTKVRNIS